MRVGRKQVGILHKFKSIKCCETQILKLIPEIELTVRLTFDILNMLSGLGRSCFFEKQHGAGSEFSPEACESVLTLFFFGIIIKTILEREFSVWLNIKDVPNAGIHFFRIIWMKRFCTEFCMASYM